jgi:zinc finger protein
LLTSPAVTQSDTAGMTIPEIDLELNPGTLGGRFTTLEGLLNQVYEELDEKVFANGDAAVAGATDEMAKFLSQLKLVSSSFHLHGCRSTFTVMPACFRTSCQPNLAPIFAEPFADSGSSFSTLPLSRFPQVMNARMPFTVILDDPLSNSYIQNIYAPDVDPCLSEEIYDRTHEQNEELGLNDMKTEDYGHVHVDEGESAPVATEEKEKVEANA